MPDSRNWDQGETLEEMKSRRAHDLDGIMAYMEVCEVRSDTAWMIKKAFFTDDLSETLEDITFKELVAKLPYIPENVLKKAFNQLKYGHF